MVSQSSPASATETELPAIDDFKLINGIGPATERSLHEAGILTFAQLASMSPDEIMALLNNFAGLSSQRIGQQDWIGQARELAPETEEVETEQATPETKDQQHYATFTVELLLDEQNQARRTCIIHIQTGYEKTWAGWDESQLVKFMTKRAQLPERISPSDNVTRLAGKRGLHNLEIIPASAAGLRNLLQDCQPFDIQLTLDLTELAWPPQGSLGYAAIFYAKDLTGGSRQLVGESQGALPSADTLRLNVANLTLPAGVYRLEAFVTLTLLPAKADLEIMLEGDLLQIYS